MSKWVVWKFQCFFRDLFTLVKLRRPIKLTVISEWDHFLIGGKQERRLQVPRGYPKADKDIVLDGQERLASTAKGRKRRWTEIVRSEDKANAQYRIIDHTRDPSLHPSDLVNTDCGTALVDIPHRRQLTCNHSKWFVEPKSRGIGKILNHINGVEAAHFPIQHAFKQKRGLKRLQNLFALKQFLDEFDWSQNYTNNTPEDRFFTAVLCSVDTYSRDVWNN